MDPQFIPQNQQDHEEFIINTLKLNIQLNNTQMHHLVSNQQLFVQKITQYNNLAKQRINKKTQLQISQALVYLNEAEKILQYAAGCGKNINRQLIVCVLHNQACVYQILWQLEQCSNYLQALIFNYQRFIKESNQFSLPPSYINAGSQINGGSHINYEAERMFGFAGGSEISYISKLKDPHSMSKLELKLLNYYFEHCAVSSQLQKNRKALQSAKKGIKLLKNSFIEQKSILMEEMKGYMSKQENIDIAYRLLQGLSEMSEKIDVNGYKEILKSAHFSLQIWSKNKQEKNKLQGKQQGKIEEKVRDLAIGTIMQILPREFNKMSNQTYTDNQQNSIFSLPDFILRVFFLSVAYFSVATQLRLLSNLLFKNRKDQDKKNSHEYKQSMLYHLIAIIISTLFIPFQCKYIQDILNSYSRHYFTNLQEYKPIQPQSITKISQLLGFYQQQLPHKQKMTRSTKSSTHTHQQLPNQYSINPNHQLVKRNKKSNQYQQNLNNKQQDQFKHSKNQPQTPKNKKSRADSKTSKMKRSISKQSVNIKDKIQTKYNELQKILSADNLNLLDQGPKSPIKKLKSSEKQKAHHFSKDKITITKKVSIKQKEDIKIKQKTDNKNTKVQKQKTQRKTKNSQKKEEQKSSKQNLVTEQDEQFFFYMTKKTTKTNNNQNANLFSPKQSLKSISNSRRSSGKKSVCSSRSNSKNSPRVVANIHSPNVNSPVSKGFLNIKKLISDKKSTKTAVQGPISVNRNYF